MSVHTDGIHSLQALVDVVKNDNLFDLLFLLQGSGPLDWTTMFRSSCFARGPWIGKDSWVLTSCWLCRVTLGTSPPSWSDVWRRGPGSAREYLH